jgi:hypothetical protein
LKEAWQLGAWDKGSANLVASIIGQDPSSDWNTGAIGSVISQKMYENPNSFRERLDSVAEGLERAAKNRMVQLGNKFGSDEKVFQRDQGLDLNTPEAKAGEAIAEGKTPKEVAEGLRTTGSGTLSKLSTFAADRLRFVSREDQAAAAEERGSLKYPGLGKTQEAGFDTYLKAYKAGDPKAGDALVAKVTTLASDRPDTAIALAHNIRDYAPDLYTKMRSTIPKGGELDKQLDYEEKSRIGSSMVPTPNLATAIASTLDADGKVTDQESWKELARRATSGDKDAKRALLDITTRSQNIKYQKSLPAGSIFKQAGE